jgi:hypothetical protein
MGAQDNWKSLDLAIAEIDRLRAINTQLLQALGRLRLEAIHYRNTGIGQQFLNEAITAADAAIRAAKGEGNG